MMYVRVVQTYITLKYQRYTKQSERGHFEIYERKECGFQMSISMQHNTLGIVVLAFKMRVTNRDLKNIKTT